MQATAQRVARLRSVPPPIPFPDQSTQAREHLERQAAAFREQMRMIDAVNAAYRNGKSDGHTVGFREGFMSGAPWHRFVGAFYGVFGLGLLLIGAVTVGIRVSKLW